MPLSRDEHLLDMIDAEMLDYGDHLTEWEHDFIVAIRDRIAKGQETTDRQLEVLEKINKKLVYAKRRNF